MDKWEACPVVKANRLTMVVVHEKKINTRAVKIDHESHFLQNLKNVTFVIFYYGFLFFEIFLMSFNIKSPICG